MTVNTTSAVIQNLENNVVYFIWVRAVNNAGRSDYSPPESGTPRLPTVVPSVPGGPVIIAGSSELSVSWQAAELAESYEVWLGTTNNSGQAQKQGGDIIGLSTAITGLTNGTIYYVWIRAKNIIGVSDFSPSASTKPIGNMGAVTVSAGNQQLSISWDAVAGADQYEIYYSTANTMPPSPVQTVSTTTATISYIVNGTTYYVWVRGINAHGAGGYSSPVIGTPIGNASAPTLIPGNARIIVSWNAIAGADQYEVFYGTDVNPPPTAAQTVNAPATTATITGLTNGASYNVWIRGKTATGTGAYSAPANAKPIGAMGTVTLNAEGQQLVVSWSTVAGADQYEVYYSTANTMPPSPVQTVTTTTAIIGGLTNGTTYYVWVRGKNTHGESNVSAVASGRPLGMPGAPVVSPSYKALSVTWTAVAGADEYEIYYGTGTPATLATTTARTTATITGLTNGTTYNVRLRAKNANGISDYGPSIIGVPSNVIPIPGLYRGDVKLGNHNLDASLTYISANAVNGDHYYIVIGEDESVAPKSLNYFGKTVGITLLGFGGERKITLISNGSMFTVSSGVTLTLDENITLIGRSQNNFPLVWIENDSIVIMNEGTRVTGNRSGGVVVNGTFTMNGGIISGSIDGGGISVINNGIFIMHGGIISGNSGILGGVYVDANGIFKKLPPSGGGQDSGIIYGSEVLGVDADEIQLRNVGQYGGDAVLAPLRRNTTADQRDYLDTTTGKGLSVSGNPPFGQ
jgi:hypothetical protein